MRIPPLMAEDTDVEAQSPQQRLAARMRGIFAHRPKLAPAFTGFSAVLRSDGELPVRLRELVRLRIAFHNQCRTCMTIRYEEALDAGVSEALVCALQDPPGAPDLTAAERAALHFADLFANNHLAIDDALFAELRGHFSDGDIVELGMLCAHWLGSGRLMAVMHVTEDLPDSATKDGVVAPWEMDSTFVFT
jgi:AhpD family alkylhydroperoxidase